MGTSKSIPTPSGGPWKPLKTDITRGLNGDGDQETPAQVVRRTISTTGLSSTGGNSSYGGGGSTGSSGAGGGGGHRQSTTSSVTRAVSGLGGFASAVTAGGLDAGLHALGLDDIRDRPAAEVVARISGHLAEGAQGTERELLERALSDSILAAAQIQGDFDYENLSGSLQSYLAQYGIEGMIELFLTQYTFDQVLSWIEEHAMLRSKSNSEVSAFSTAIEDVCRTQVRLQIEETKRRNAFMTIDWFGADGRQLGQAIVSDLEARLASSEAGERS